MNENSQICGADFKILYDANPECYGRSRGQVLPPLKEALCSRQSNHRSNLLDTCVITCPGKFCQRRITSEINIVRPRYPSHPGRDNKTAAAALHITIKPSDISLTRFTSRTPTSSPTQQPPESARRTPPVHAGASQYRRRPRARPARGRLYWQRLWSRAGSGGAPGRGQTTVDSSVTRAASGHHVTPQTRNMAGAAAAVVS